MNSTKQDLIIILGILIVSVIMFFVSCRDTNYYYPTMGCTVSQQEDGALIICNDGTSAYIKNGSECPGHSGDEHP